MPPSGTARGSSVDRHADPHENEEHGRGRDHAENKKPDQHSSNRRLHAGLVFMVAALAASLGELAAIWPTAGGQYHFVYALSPEKWRRTLVRRTCKFNYVQDATC